MAKAKTCWDDGWTLEDTIRADCKTWEQTKDNGFMQYLYLQECKDSKESGLYQLILNGHELHYGTLQEINAIVKAMIKMSETNNFLDAD